MPPPWKVQETALLQAFQLIVRPISCTKEVERAHPVEMCCPSVGHSASDVQLRVSRMAFAQGERQKERVAEMVLQCEVNLPVPKGKKIEEVAVLSALHKQAGEWLTGVCAWRSDKAPAVTGVTLVRRRPASRRYGNVHNRTARED